MDTSELGGRHWNVIVSVCVCLSVCVALIISYLSSVSMTQSILFLPLTLFCNKLLSPIYSSHQHYII